jgi:flavin reductase (DIM6/NTAB) family NADH-FMN oxidoreductase RutF
LQSPAVAGNEALMAEHDFNTLMAALDSPLIVVTTADVRERAGCLVEFHGQSSIEPQRYCVWLSKANYTLPGGAAVQPPGRSLPDLVRSAAR